MISLMSCHPEEGGQREGSGTLHRADVRLFHVGPIGWVRRVVLASVCLDEHAHIQALRSIHMYLTTRDGGHRLPA